MTTSTDYYNITDDFLGDSRLVEVGANTAIEFKDNRLSYIELRSEVENWKHRIISNAVGEEDRVALLLYDSPEFVASFFAVVSIGAICVPINTFLPPEDVAYIIADSGARLIIVEKDLESKLRDARAAGSHESPPRFVVDRSADEPLDSNSANPGTKHRAATTRSSPALLLYTSGSTGQPKGVLHVHGSMRYTVDSYARSVLRLTSDDRVYSASRLFFAYGLGNSLSFPLSAGATVILDTERPSPQYVATLFRDRRPTVFFAVPALYRALLDYDGTAGDLDVSSLRTCVSAGEALPARIVEEWKERFGLEILDGIGSTEMLHIFISNRSGSVRAGSSGRIVKGYEAKLVDDSGVGTPVGELGNLWVRGSSATAGYWQRPDLTEQTVRDGWVRTGDIYRQDADGFYYHVGRSDDCFKVRGLWVSPIEVESALVSHDDVVEAAVVPSTNQQGLATARAYVVIRTASPREGLIEELRAHLSSRLPEYKVPSQIEFLKELPRTSTGKVQRFKLRA